MTHAADKGTALITGAASAIGALYANALASRGYDLLLVAPDPSRLERFAAWLAARFQRSVAVLSADLAGRTYSDDTGRVEDLLLGDENLRVLVNNAGLGAANMLPSCEMGEVETIIALNSAAPARLAYGAALAFSARGGGTIVNVASTGAALPRARGDAEPFLVGLSRTLHAELGRSGLRIQAVMPGSGARALWDWAAGPVERVPHELIGITEAMVDEALEGLDAGELVTRIGRPRSAAASRLRAAAAAARA